VPDRVERRGLREERVTETGWRVRGKAAIDLVEHAAESVAWQR
jgi:hypothetical protein